jgi:hypothetical protein
MIEAGSFRDPAARVFYEGDRVLRGLSVEGAADDLAARQAGVVDALVSAGTLIHNWRVDDVAVPTGVPSAAVVESTRLPFVSYPQEWSFSMLRDAALATLDANLLALESGFILKDASAFNVTFDGMRPVIIDASSLERFPGRGVWNAYGQFCDHFLAPLLLEAHGGYPVSRSLTGTVVGVPIADLAALFRGRSRLAKGVFTHVRMRARVERRARDLDTSARTEVGAMTLPREAIAASMSKMRTLVTGLTGSAASTWADYERGLPYDDRGIEIKETFVAGAGAGAKRKALALDVGANAGRFTKLLSSEFERVLAIDVDPGAVDALYQLEGDRVRARVTPLVVDITNPTPSFGWRSRERRAFFDRAQPDFSTWLAVLHHLCLGTGIPLPEVLDLVHAVGPEAVVEFVDPADPMARHITATRRDPLHEYSLAAFESGVAARFDVVAAESVSPSRSLFHLRRR